VLGSGDTLRGERIELWIPEPRKQEVINKAVLYAHRLSLATLS
jgi:hypothetical protein